MSKGKKRLNNCVRKMAYFSVDEALDAIEQVRLAGKLLEPAIGVSYAAYVCTVCYHYHWGRKKELKCD